MPANTIIQFRRGSESQWISANPVLASGEPGFDITNTQLKVGDGINSWTELNTVGGSGGINQQIVFHNNNTNYSGGTGNNTHYIYIFQNSAINYSLILPTAINNTNIYTLKNNTDGTVFYETTSSQNIDGHLKIGLNRRYASITVVSDGSNWIIV